MLPQTLATILAFGAMVGHVKINYRPNNQDCTLFTIGCFVKFSFRSFLVSANGSIVENRKF